METVKMPKSPTLLWLESLKHIVNETFAHLHSSRSAAGFLHLLLAEAQGLKARVHELYARWEKRLPFGEEDARDVDWKQWSATLYPDHKATFMKRLKETGEAKYPHTTKPLEEPLTTPERETLQRLTNEVVREMKELSVLLKKTGNLLAAPGPEMLDDLYERKKRAYTEQARKKLPALTKAATHRKYYEKKYLQELMRSRFMQLMTEASPAEEKDYLKLAQRRWKQMLDEEGNVCTTEIAEAIYQHRSRLTWSDWEAYFDYITVKDYFDSLKEETTATQQGEASAQGEREKTEEKYKQTDYTNLIFKKFIDRKPIDFARLHHVIRTKCLPEISAKNHWFLLWRVLTDLGLMEGECRIGSFAEQMQLWFPDVSPSCTADSIGDYHSSHLGRCPFKEWNPTLYLNDYNRNNTHLARNAIKRFLPICNRMNEEISHFLLP